MNSRIALVIILNLLLHQDQATATLTTIFDRLDYMEVSKESKMQIIALHIAPHNNSIAQGAFRILHDMDSSKLKMKIEVIRCFVREAPDTCEYLINLKPPNVCMFFNAENMAWNGITDALTPKLRCPLKMGHYVGDALTFDANKWNIFQLDKWYFKLAYKLYEGDSLAMGLIIDVHFNRYQ